MVAIRIMPNGSRVHAGDVLVEFDTQAQMKAVSDRQAEYDALELQIQRMRAEHTAAISSDEIELNGADLDVRTALVETQKNDVVPQNQAKINMVNLAEAEAKYKQIQETLKFKNEVRLADARILEIQRDRARQAIDRAVSNIEKMKISSPMDGLVVLSQISKGSRRMYPVAGDEFYPGAGIMTVVDTGRMQVSATLNQIDVSRVRVGQTAEVRLDAYPALVFSGKVERIGSAAVGSRRVQQFSIIVSILESHPNLLPDLTASVDLPLNFTPMESADD